MMMLSNGGERMNLEIDTTTRRNDANRKQEKNC